MSLDLRSLYQTEADSLFALLGRFGLAGADLEDAMHDTFVTAMARWATFDPRRPARPWLMGIAFRVGVARLRARREVGVELPEERDLSQDPERTAEARQALRLLQRALIEVNEDQGRVFVMFDLQGVPAAELAQSMGVPLATIYSRLRLGRQAVQEAVQRYRQKELP